MEKNLKFVKKTCRICRSDKEIDYKDIEFLKTFINRRGKIVPRIFTGNCAKHQRQIAKAIKRSRNLAFLPFVY
ncbi:MAG: 30S ribosomal protein S18 [Elusimicrobiota bacterium]